MPARGPSFVRLASGLFAAVGLAWLVVLFALTMIGHHPTGPCGRALPVTSEHQWAIGIALTSLLLTRSRFAFACAREWVPSLSPLAAGLMLWLATQALLVPHHHCGFEGEPATPWSAWHHFAVLALEIFVALAGVPRARPPART